MGIKTEFAIPKLFTPLNTIKSTIEANIMPKKSFFIGKREETAFTCTKFPVVKELITQI